MILNLFHFFRGYLTIEAEGYLLERFINICTRRSIYLWNIKYASKNKMYAAVSTGDFMRIRGAAFKSHSRVRIKKRHGLPFLAYRYKKRQAFVFGILLFAILLFLMSSMLWKVEIAGLESTSYESVSQILRESGVRKWVFTRSIDTDKVKFNLMQELDSLSWVGIDVKGSTMTIEVRERKKAPQIIPLDQPCNLVAAKDGIIYKMLVKEGENQVAVGDTVWKGQLLVSALKGVEVENPLKVHAYGEVIARTWYEKSMERKLYNERREYTGAETKKRRIEFFGFRINLYGKTSIPYQEYDTIEDRKGNMIAFVTEHYKEVNVYREPIALEDALNDAEEKLMQQLAAEAVDGLQVKNTIRDYVYEDQDTILVKCVFECLENIAEQQAYTEQQGELTNDGEDTADKQDG